MKQGRKTTGLKIDSRVTIVEGNPAIFVYEHHHIFIDSGGIFLGLMGHYRFVKMQL